MSKFWTYQESEEQYDAEAHFLRDLGAPWILGMVAILCVLAAVGWMTHRQVDREAATARRLEAQTREVVGR